MEPDVRRIALVTRRFQELQGLQKVALGVWLLLILLRKTVPLLDSAQQQFGVLSSSYLVTIVLLRWYYARRFGRIEQRDDNRLWWLIWIGVSAALVDSLTYGSGVPSAFFFAIAAFGVGIVLRDWPHRTHFSVLGAVALVASLTFASVHDDDSRRQWARQALVTMAGAMIVSGVGDHRLLSSTLRGGTLEADAVECSEGE